MKKKEWETLRKKEKKKLGWINGLPVLNGFENEDEGKQQNRKIRGDWDRADESLRSIEFRQGDEDPLSLISKQTV